MTHLPRLASLVFNRPHYISRDAGLAIANVISRGQMLTPQGNRFIGDAAVEEDGPKKGQWKGFRLSGSTAIINVMGELVNRGAWLGTSSGLVSYEGLAQQLRAAAADPRVKGILLDVNSPGGEAAGMTDIATLVRAIAAEKPVVAVCNAMMASAAYGLCAGATRIVTTSLGVVGSIGVVMMHADYSQALSEAGVRVTLIHEGEHKVDGNPFEKLPADVRDDFQAECAKYYAAFVATVAAGRPGLTEAAIRATEARTYLGGDAVEMGLADEVGTFEAALADLEAGRITTQRSAVTVTTQEPPPRARATSPQPSNPQPEPSLMTDKTHTKADLDTAVAQASADASAAERTRIKTILGSDAAKGRADMAAHIAFNTAMTAADATAMLAVAPVTAPAAAAPAVTPVAASTETVMGLELASPSAAKPATDKKAINTSSIYATRRA